MPNMTVKGAIQASLAAFAKIVKAAIPSKVSELDNDSGYITNAGVTGVKGSSESSFRAGDVSLTKDNIGLGNVENKSSATIRNELTKQNVTNALGYEPAEEIDADELFLAVYPVGSYYMGLDPSSHGGTWTEYRSVGMPPMWLRTA